MFDLSSRNGKLLYDGWMLANAWNRYANMYAQY